MSKLHVLFLYFGLTTAIDVMVCTFQSCYETEPDLPRPTSFTGSDGKASFLIPFVWTDLAHLTTTTSVKTTITQTDKNGNLITPTDASMTVQPKGYWWRNQLLGPPVTPPGQQPSGAPPAKSGSPAAPSNNKPPQSTKTPGQSSGASTANGPQPSSTLSAGASSTRTPNPNTPVITPITSTSSSTNAGGVVIPVPITLPPPPPPNPGGTKTPQASNQPGGGGGGSSGGGKPPQPSNQPGGSGGGGGGGSKPPQPSNQPGGSGGGGGGGSKPPQPSNQPGGSGGGGGGGSKPPQPSNQPGGSGGGGGGVGHPPNDPNPNACKKPQTADACTVSCIAQTNKPQTTLTTSCFTTECDKYVACTATPITTTTVRTKTADNACTLAPPLGSDPLRPVGDAQKVMDAADALDELLSKYDPEAIDSTTSSGPVTPTATPSTLTTSVKPPPSSGNQPPAPTPTPTSTPSPPPITDQWTIQLHQQVAPFLLGWSLIDSNGKSVAQGQGTEIRADQLPHPVTLDVRDKDDKDKVKIIFTYQVEDQHCQPAWSTSQTEKFLGFCISTRLPGNWKPGCDDGSVQWKQVGSGFFRDFKCTFQGFKG